MRHSIYVKLAAILLHADLKRETRQWQRLMRRQGYHLPALNTHLLKDIGLDFEGRSNRAYVPDAVKTERKTRHLRRVLSLRIMT
ncbi:DUF1127 domain-containing protein [Vibrio azureus]|uniref:DUF1127 domain-containing protein n=1 Tax=Vibrio azureus NBRC 104587 TaxID=1219077 RepID=U3CDT3_9VIBR|nr:hypothetical protein [Vibrio azureus]AUI85330.1 DUF1127 domain-containing protein [Vibrio azureus]GAD76493.1 hypothetical protein VAZ01S_045_00160 [Vibrio azureus NBRC 104587]